MTTYNVFERERKISKAADRFLDKEIDKKEFDRIYEESYKESYRAPRQKETERDR